MGDRDFYDELRNRALAILREGTRSLELHPENSTGAMAPHVAIEQIVRLRRIASKLDAIADFTERMAKK